MIGNTSGSKAGGEVGGVEGLLATANLSACEVIGSIVAAALTDLTASV